MDGPLPKRVAVKLMISRSYAFWHEPALRLEVLIPMGFQNFPQPSHLGALWKSEFFLSAYGCMKRTPPVPVMGETAISGESRFQPSGAHMPFWAVVLLLSEKKP